MSGMRAEAATIAEVDGTVALALEPAPVVSDPFCHRLSSYALGRQDLTDDERTLVLAVVADFEHEVLPLPVVAVMTADESEKLRSRLHRAENAARKTEAERV